MIITKILTLALALSVAQISLARHHGCEASEKHMENEEGFVSLFNGENLDGWDGDQTIWRVEDGAIVGETLAEGQIVTNTYLIWEGGQPSDFELKVKFKIDSGNSGIQIRSLKRKKGPHAWGMIGYQSDFDAENKWTGLIYGERFRGKKEKKPGGLLAKPGEKAKLVSGKKEPITIGSLLKEGAGEKEVEELKAHHKIGEWNEYTINCKGNTLTHYINGVLMAQLVDEDDEKRLNEGYIGLQVHWGQAMKVSFKDIYLKEFSTEEEEETVEIENTEEVTPAE